MSAHQIRQGWRVARSLTNEGSAEPLGRETRKGEDQEVQAKRWPLASVRVHPTRANFERRKDKILNTEDEVKGVWMDRMLAVENLHHRHMDPGTR